MGLKGYEPVALCDQPVKIDLLGPLMMAALYTVEGDELATGQQDTLREGECLGRLWDNKDLPLQFNTEAFMDGPADLFGESQDLASGGAA